MERRRFICQGCGEEAPEPVATRRMAYKRFCVKTQKFEWCVEEKKSVVSK